MLFEHRANGLVEAYIHHRCDKEARLLVIPEALVPVTSNTYHKAFLIFMQITLLSLFLTCNSIFIPC